jgi:ectoine hydroxylase-related dioxygenase (phytanoyl-CoA dioxygenase family)
MPSFNDTRKKGFLIVENVLSDSECDRTLTEIADFRGERAGRRDLIKLPTVVRIANDDRMVEIAKSFLGPAAIPYKAALFEKSKESNWLVPWHQDRTLPFCRKFESLEWGPWTRKDGIHFASAPTWALENIVALRLHLDDSTLDNGPLRVIPNSHLLGVTDQSKVVVTAFSSEATVCTVRKGGVIALRPLLIHGSSKSKGRAPRRVLHIEYAVSVKLSDEIVIGSSS